MEVKLDNTAKEKLLIPIDKASGGFEDRFKEIKRCIDEQSKL